jgi:hypothetical protein
MLVKLAGSFSKETPNSYRSLTIFSFRHLIKQAK